MNAIKAGILVVWAISIGSFFIGTDSAIAAAGRTTFWFLIVAHLVEIAVFSGKLKAAPGGIAGNFLPTFLFGIFHVRSLE
jgi:uncharacterized protein YhhL (DUF1145 family)